MRYLLDSGIASDYIHRRAGVHRRAQALARQGHQIGIGTPVLGELLGGILASDTREQNLPILRRNLGRFKLWPFDGPAAEEYGGLWADLRRRGRPMQVPDMQIAAIALSLGDCVVVSKDSDLRAVPGLEVEDWSQP